MLSPSYRDEHQRTGRDGVHCGPINGRRSSICKQVHPSTLTERKSVALVSHLAPPVATNGECMFRPAVVVHTAPDVAQSRPISLGYPSLVEKCPGNVRLQEGRPTSDVLGVDGDCATRISAFTRPRT